MNDKDDNKIKQLRSVIEKEYSNLENQNVEVKYLSCDVQKFKLLSKNYYRLIFLDQYGIQHINKIQEFLCKGTDILVFISSGHLRRFLDEKSFQKHFDNNFISKEDFKGKSNYETHRVITQYFKKLSPGSFVSPFSLIKDNNNINGLIFISTHQKGQEQFLKTAWSIDKDFGEGNKNIDRDYKKDRGSLFYDKDCLSTKEENYTRDLREFLIAPKTNLEIRAFSFDNGFLTKCTNKILYSIHNNLSCEYCNEAKKGFHLGENKEIKVRISLKDSNEANKD